VIRYTFLLNSRKSDNTLLHTSAVPVPVPLVSAVPVPLVAPDVVAPDVVALRPIADNIHPCREQCRHSTLNNCCLAPRGLANRMTYNKAYQSPKSWSVSFTMRLFGIAGGTLSITSRMASSFDKPRPLKIAYPIAGLRDIPAPQ